jgi:outer membrane protein OmpA-like peptidoglycan-associated protein
LKNTIATITVLLIITSCQPKLNGVRTELHFDHDSTNINEVNLSTLIGITEFCKKYTNIHLTVSGFSDTIGTEAYNLEMSKLRALKVYNYIMKHSKINVANTTVNWFGESEVFDESNHEPHNCVVVSIETPKGVHLLMDGSRQQPGH